MSKILSIMACALAITTTLASPINSTLTARDPLFQGGFIDHCNLYVVTPHGEAYGHLQGDCSLDPSVRGSEISSSLDLSLCLGNYDNHLGWGYFGGAMASCTNCVSRHFDTQYLDCDCGSIDLNEGVYMADNGALACYDQVAIPHIVPT
ncbi:hypothetical protein F503_01614 [Ophiostoma piceae UAMH 11346]|uniref:Cyanovirin-N domain-containing protein n=1 Tax=Ophiostoma piceae (strain UAMH 11346) TaxID=1262450 RepID=S3C9J1_OPHP1|nr:hypothetical protein F503_01614 [Ophiostoma piceae UAMH 11346]